MGWGYRKIFYSRVWCYCYHPDLNYFLITANPGVLYSTVPEPFASDFFLKKDFIYNDEYCVIYI